MTNHIRWGVLGASNFAKTTMAPAINEARRSVLAAVASRHTEKAAPFAELAPGLRVHNSYDALLADPEIDAIYIPLPNALHVEWSLKAAEAGKAVLCEKPIALTEADFDRLIAARDLHGHLIAEAFMPVHHPQWTKTRDLIAEGAIGDLHHVTGVFTYGLSDPANVRNSADLAGGALRDVGVYPIGTFRFATGLEPEVTDAEMIREAGVDASTWISAQVGAARLRFHVSMRASRRQEMVFEGTQGHIRLPAPFNAGNHAEAQVQLWRDGREDRIFRFPKDRQYVAQVEAFNATLLDGAPYACPLEFSRGTQAMIDAVFEVVS